VVRAQLGGGKCICYSQSPKRRDSFGDKGEDIGLTTTLELYSGFRLPSFANTLMSLLVTSITKLACLTLHQIDSNT
jgi:hypothetical protein